MKAVLLKRDPGSVFCGSPIYPYIRLQRPPMVIIFGTNHIWMVSDNSREWYAIRKPLTDSPEVAGPD